MDEPIDHFRKILRGLLERAKKNEVNWQVSNIRAARSSYLVEFPASAITVEFFSPESEPDYYVARLFNDRRNAVQTLGATESEKGDWELLSNLSTEAYRAVTGWDKAMADAEASVNSNDPVGKPGDDIPF